MSYVPLGPRSVWRCLPVVAASELIYVAMITPGLDFADLDRDNEHRKRIQICRNDLEIVLVWCTWIADGTSTEFLVDSEGATDERLAAEAFRIAALHRARRQGWLPHPPGFGREDLL